MSCNGVELLKVDVQNRCTSIKKDNWKNKIGKVLFSDFKQAAKEYRVKPGKFLNLCLELQSENEKLTGHSDLHNTYNSPED